MVYARVVDGIVFEIFTVPNGLTIGECFVAELVAQFIDVTNVSPQPHQNWTHSGIQFLPPT